jgi:hypothetical protein
MTSPKKYFKESGVRLVQRDCAIYTAAMPERQPQPISLPELRVRRRGFGPFSIVNYAAFLKRFAFRGI